MSKTRIKLIFICLAVIACFAFTISSVIKAIDAAGNDEQVIISSSVSYGAQPESSDIRAIAGRTRHSSSHQPYSTPYQQPQHQQSTPVVPSLVTYRVSSATVHSIGGGGGGAAAAGNHTTTNRQSSIVQSSMGTVVPLLAVNNSAFSVNRDLTETSGQSVAGMAARRIAPPDDGGSTIGGTPNIAPPDDGGELLGSPVGEIPVLFIVLLGCAYALSIRRSRKLKQA